MATSRRPPRPAGSGRHTAPLRPRPARRGRARHARSGGGGGSDGGGILRPGKLIALESVAGLRSKGIRQVTFEFAAPVEPAVFAGVPGVRSVDVVGGRISLSFDGTMAALLKIAEQHDVLDVSTEEADLEEIFLTYYRDEAVPA